MTATTVAYNYPSVTVTFTAFGGEIQVGSVYGITYMSDGCVHINSAEYPFHYELRNTEITVLDTNATSTTHVVEVE